MNYQAYYAALSVIVIAFGLSVYAAHRRNKRCEAGLGHVTIGRELVEAVGKVRVAGLAQVVPGDARIHSQGQSIAAPQRAQRSGANAARDKVLAELNRRTENWASKRRSLNLTNKRQLLIIRELKQLVDQDRFTEICRGVNALDAEAVLDRAAGK